MAQFDARRRLLRRRSIISWSMLYVFVLLFLLPAASTAAEEPEFPADEVIQLPVGRFPDPDCAYSVRFKDNNGRKVDREVSVGEQLFHSWNCEYGDHENNLFCMMVHNCTVSSNKQRQQQVEIIDEFGCSLFPTILPHVSYSGDLDAGLQVHAFSLDVEQAAVYFSCNVKMLLKLNGVCRRPICQPLEKFGRPSRRRKSAFY
ncbi:unnamed protein product [Caenorhabditis auriculariae]|uniref:ZP domain-containing protein n=1 Tax=Caenorhabditis auriculariae TaxID=2777116 RepID=A0A8S1HFG8_9PELO|nr:unnamed protein product [Caenorhabditis auriculariae]